MIDQGSEISDLGGEVQQEKRLQLAENYVASFPGAHLGLLMNVFLRVGTDDFHALEGNHHSFPEIAVDALDIGADRAGPV
jgi:hypothetical protein